MGEQAPAPVDGERPFFDLRQVPFAGAEVVDRYSYRIRIEGRYPQFQYWLAMPFFSPMPWEVEALYSQPGMKQNNITLDWYPVGTGAYMLTENNPNMRMVLARNPNFHGEAYPSEGMPEDVDAGLLADAGKPLPFVERAVYSLDKESIPYWNKFLQGFYDSSGISSDAFDQAVQFDAGGEAGLTDDMREKGIELVTAVDTSIWYMGFNMVDPLLGGDSERARLLRQAISIAVDFGEYISIFANGRGLEAQGAIPPGIFGHREGRAGMNPEVFDWHNGRPIRKGIDQAKALLAKAGYRDGRDPETGRPLTIYYEAMDAGPDGKARLNWMRKQFAKLGIELVVRATDYNRFQEKMREGTGQVFMWGWNADYPDPENFFFLLYGPNKKIDGGENAANYQNPEFDALFEQMKNMDDGPERQQIIDRMNDILRFDAPWSFGFYPKSFSLHHQWLGNVKPNLMANNTLKYRSLDPAIREQLREQWNPPVLWPIGALAAGACGRRAAGHRHRASTRTEPCPVSAYIIRRLLYALPILIGVNLITFMLFFVVNSPDDMARMQLGDKRVTQEAIDGWKAEHGYDLPLLFNDEAGGLDKVTETIFFQKSVKLFAFDFGSSDSGRDIGYDISQRMWPSLAIALPVLIVGLAINISYALMIIFFRATYIDFGSVILLVAMMSISGLFYIIGGQFLIGKLFHLVPISGYDTGLEAAKFLLLPVHRWCGGRHRHRHPAVSDLLLGGGQSRLCAHRPRQGPA